MNNVFKRKHKQEYAKAKDLLDAVDTVEAHADELEGSIFRDTLNETIRKQHAGCNLTQITDGCYEIFQGISDFIASVLHVENLKHCRANLLNVIIQTVFDKFIDKWLTELNFSSNATATTLFKIILKTFTKVMTKQFMKDIKPKEQKAHRVQVLISTSSVQSVKSLVTKTHSDESSVRREAHTNNNNVCGVCRDADVDKSDMVGCDKCAQWYHCKCINMSRAMFNRVKRYKRKKWMCSGCTV